MPQVSTLARNRDARAAARPSPLPPAQNFSFFFFVCVLFLFFSAVVPSRRALYLLAAGAELVADQLRFFRPPIPGAGVGTAERLARWRAAPAHQLAAHAHSGLRRGLLRECYASIIGTIIGV